MQDNLARKTNAPAKLAVAGNTVEVPLETGMTVLPIIPLPEKFVDWIEQGRRSMYEKLQGKASPGFFTSHLPVMVTQSAGKAFPFNCGNKGVGYLPKPEYLDHFVRLFRDTIERTKGRPWQESMAERIKAVSSFYFDREKVDYRALSSLEIFEKTTFANLTRLPLCALHYTGNGPDYVSFQVNCAVEIIGPDDPRHEFIKLARVMFEYDSFHIAQHEFPYAYVFWISEVSDKTPFRVPEKDGKIVTLTAKGSMRWEPEAIESINRAPGMIRQFITEGIEKYARERGFTEITLKLVREAREVLERTPPPAAAQAETGPAEAAKIGNYKRIYVGLDSSDLSTRAMDLALEIGKLHGSELIGSHVYAAKMHDNRFRAMEGGLPEEFQKEKELNRQRKIHDSLITKGLELITDSYLEGMASACARARLPFTAVSLEGRNWQALVEDIRAHDYDLIALGAHGIGRVGHSQLGTVAERVIRRTRRDVLLCRQGSAENAASDTIVVCLDGSTRSWGGLERAFELARTFGKKIVAVSAFDPYFHYAMFKSLNKALTDKARKVFKFEEQEKLHEDIIDSGLAKIYQSYLNIAKRLAGEAGIEIEIKLLDGKPFEKILHFVKQANPWLLVVGRIGFHSDEEMDIGGNTENLCRMAPCNMLIVDSQAKPPVEFQAEETVNWTKEALARMDRVPAMARNMAVKAVQGYCVAEGHTVVTESILNAALKTLLPPEALARMGIADGDDAKARDDHDKIALSFRCQACGHVHRGSRPQACTVCGMGGHLFKLLESEAVADGQALQTLGDRQLLWDKPALEALESVPDATARTQIRNRLEKRSLTQRITAVTLAMVEDELAAAGLKPARDLPPAPAGADASAPTLEPRVVAGPEAPAARPIWTESALARMERVPEGFMRQAAKAMVEKHAQELGRAEISLETAEEGLGKARAQMHAGMAGGHPHGVQGASGMPHAHPHAGARAEGMPAPEAAANPPADWECHLCGLIHRGERPHLCAACKTGHLVPLTAEQAANAKPAAFLAVEWDEAAKQRLERVPPGFMRDMTRSRVEKWARAAGRSRVDLETMDGKYGNWGAGAAKVELALAWDAEAQARADRIPDFIRPMVQKEIERVVKGQGRGAVTCADIDSAMAKWSEGGHFHGHKG
jgi:nucleotide-binding universal stress UspA family protein/rubrerythrin